MFVFVFVFGCVDCAFGDEGGTCGNLCGEVGVEKYLGNDLATSAREGESKGLLARYGGGRRLGVA